MLKRVSSILTKLLISFIVVCILILVIPSILNLHIYSVNTENMEPYITRGSMIYVRNLSSGEIHVDDIIAYRSLENSNLIQTAKITSIDSDYSMVIKSEIDSTEDMLMVMPEQLIGNVKFSIPLLGYIVSYMQTTTGIFLGAVLLTLMISLSVLNEVNEQKNNEVELNSELDIKIINKVVDWYNIFSKKTDNVKRKILNRLHYFTTQDGKIADRNAQV